MLQAYNTYEYCVDCSNIDAHGEIKIPTLWSDVVNAVELNIRKEGYGADLLAERDQAWVLLRTALEIDSRPRLYDSLHIEVWTAPSSPITQNRCVSIFDDKGREYGRGTTEWCIIDKRTRRPVAVDFHSNLIQGRNDLPCKGARRIKDFEVQESETHNIKYCECDFNGHLNNTRYIEYLFNLIPEEQLEKNTPFRIDINYRKEALKGQNITLGLAEQAPGHFVFCAKGGDNTLCSASYEQRT